MSRLRPGSVGKPFKFRGFNASIFAIFCSNMPRILRGIHLSELERPKNKSKGSTAHATAVVYFFMYFSAGFVPAG